MSVSDDGAINRAPGVDVEAPRIAVKTLFGGTEQGDGPVTCELPELSLRSAHGALRSPLQGIVGAIERSATLRSLRPVRSIRLAARTAIDVHQDNFSFSKPARLKEGELRSAVNQ